MSFFIFVFLNIIKDMTCCWCLCRFCVSCLSEAPLPLRPVSDLSAVMTIKAGAGGVGGPVASLLESPLHCSRPACPELLTSCAFRQLMLQMKLCSGPTPEMLLKPINKNPPAQIAQRLACSSRMGICSTHASLYLSVIYSNFMKIAVAPAVINNVFLRVIGTLQHKFRLSPYNHDIKTTLCCSQGTLLDDKCKQKKQRTWRSIQVGLTVERSCLMLLHNKNIFNSQVKHCD